MSEHSPSTSSSCGGWNGLLFHTFSAKCIAFQGEKAREALRMEVHHISAKRLLVFKEGVRSTGVSFDLSMKSSISPLGNSEGARRPLMSEETAGAEKSTGERRGFRLWRAWGLVTSSFALHTRQKYSSETRKKKKKKSRKKYSEPERT